MTHHRLQDVFGIVNSINQASYVNRGGLDERIKYYLDTERHLAIHGDSKQGKSWLRSRALSADEILLVQCQPDTTPESIIESALSQLGVRAELSRSEGHDLSGTLDFTGSGQVGVALLGKLGLEVNAQGHLAKTEETDSQTIGKTTADTAWVAGALLEGGRRLVIEDFHYVAEVHRQSLAFLLKALGEYGVYAIIVGIWPEDHLLSYYNGDLVGRVEDVHLDWSREELAEVLELGSSALHIGFSEALSAAILEGSYGSVGLLQNLAEKVCVQNGVYETCEELRQIELDGTFADALRDVSQSMVGRFGAFADNFVRGMRRMPEGLEVYKHLLRTVSEATNEQLTDGFDSAALLEAINAHEDADIRMSDLTQALERIDRLQVKIGISPPVLTYNADSRKLFLSDRSFLFFREQGDPAWPWTDHAIENDLAESDPLTFDDI